ncbi:MAG: PD40 domain-containing protein [Bacteroidaceae bacterium]|nr:PD40 domain-containing protein [Bacteroidaceae bacterium]
MNKAGLLHIILCTLVAVCLCSCGAEKALRKAEQAEALGEYFEAAKYYKQAYSKTSTKERDKRGERAFKMGECYRLINYSSRAVGAYKNAVRYKYPEDIAMLRLADMQRMSGDYKGATKNYQLYLDQNPGDEAALNGLKACEDATLWKKNPNRYIVKKFDFFNSRRAEYSPMYAGEDTDQIFFTSTRDGVKGEELSGITGMNMPDIFVARKDEKGKWQKPEPIDSEVNSEHEDGACAFTPDGKTMYFTRCQMDSDYPRYAEIYKSTRSDASWSSPQKCEITNDTLSSVAHPAVSPDGEWLYFVSDMPGGFGGTDIWRVRVSDAGFEWVENVGEPINTPGNEMFPTFRPNGELYFSSNGHPGMGGLDLFKAIWDDKKETWSIENMQSPMNSQADDFGMTFEGPYNRGFFSSSRGDARGWDHIYTFELPEIVKTITGWVYEKEGYELPNAVVHIVGEDGTNKKVSVKMDGSFTELVNAGTSYVLLGSCDGFLNYKQEIEMDTLMESTDHVLQFPLSSMTHPVLLENIFYEFNKATLTDASTASLDSLIVLLNDNPNVTIELGAHCDYKGSEAYNERLSQQRAESVVNYLIKGGIAANRLVAKGYGESTPRVLRKKLAAQLGFLKEGDVLSEQFILTLNEEQQEICNALNRRTEFKVLRTTYRLYE